MQFSLAPLQLRKGFAFRKHLGVCGHGLSVALRRAYAELARSLRGAYVELTWSLRGACPDSQYLICILYLSYMYLEGSYKGILHVLYLLSISVYMSISYMYTTGAHTKSLRNTLFPKVLTWPYETEGVAYAKGCFDKPQVCPCPG